MLDTLYEQYDLAYRNKVMDDGNQLQITLKPLTVDQHNIRKRKADEDSGKGKNHDRSVVKM